MYKLGCKIIIRKLKERQNYVFIDYENELIISLRTNMYVGRLELSLSNAIENIRQNCAF